MALHRSGLAEAAGLSTSIFRPSAIQLLQREAFIFRRDQQKKQLPKASATASAATCFRPATKSATAVLNYYRSTALYQKHLGVQEEEAFLETQLRLLVNAASDRAQMHAILAQQRDNWNKLFQNTLTLATFTACLLAALSARTHSVSPSLSIPALLLNIGCAAVMSIVN